jgi:hypothetical protein
MDIQFYDVKNRKKVAVSDKEVKKTKYERQTKDGGTQVRYALRAVVGGVRLTKFVSQKDWESLDAPQE